MKYWSLIVIVLLMVGLTLSTLSPPKDKQRKDKGKKKDNQKGPVDQSVFDRGLVVKDPKNIDILRESGLYHQDTNHRNFDGEVLGYITPWNSGGLEVAKTFHGKLTSVSPTWLTLPNGSIKEFKIATHDVQEKWLKDIRTANDAIHQLKVLPRLLFENWKPKEIINLHKNEARRAQLVQALIETAKKHKFHGYVLEIWIGFYYSGVDTRIIIDLIKSLSEELKKNNLQVVLVIPPSRSSETDVFSQTHFDLLSPIVDYFSLMTYDYSSVQRPGPNSPLDWARKCIEKLVPNDDDPRRQQILMGLNFYGYNYSLEGGGAILGSQYLELVESHKGKIKWDDGSKEHYFEVKTKVGSSFVFYPTLFSLQQRIQLAKDMGTGISIWELGQGLNYFYDLL
ncbi:hypothetical protein HCN44_010217 [Aphidius gifuensis]|uniref:Chitinase domain-containing protein 1 n=1 Tax=Aphidius gifuensis TaxID=684658 RepID=A0A834XXT5_APHGI|nr:chitinase domain-containing protein 1-like [Aphidius gifuensis]KAF7993622.1 hypothetical protein HCN44_010217 [Aphidius gifuensis]